MTKRQFDILTLLERSAAPFTQRKIAKSTGMSVGTVNKVMQELEESGCVAGNRITKGGLNALEPYRVKRAIFLAAGFGARMVPITFNTPKPLVRVNGVRMIDTLLDAVVAAGIPEIVIVRGYLGEQFDQLIYKYPNIRFVENPAYNECNNISSAMCVRYLLQNAYVCEADLILRNPDLIRKYEYCSNFLGIPVKLTDDWCIHTDSSGIVISEEVGGEDCYQMVGVSYWSESDGAKLANDLNEVFTSPGGKERYWEQTALVYRKENYKVMIRPCSAEDIIEIDTFSELKRVDQLYAG